MPKNMKTITLLLTISFFFCSSALAGESILVPIPKEQIEYGCGCGYRLNKSAPYQTVFQSELNFEMPKAFIEGKLVKLSHIKIEGIPKNPKVGDKFTQQYRFKDIILKFSNTITFVCPIGSEGGCEVTEFKSTIEKIQNGKVEEGQLFGDCGC
jgi:hypothetical protein